MQTASFGLLACGAVFEFSMDRTSVCVCGPDSCHLTPGPCPDQGCQSFRGACFSPKPLPTDIVRKHTVTQCMYYDPDLIWPYGQNIVTWQHLYSFVKIYGYMLNQWPCDFHMIAFPTHPIWWRWSHFICWQATKSLYNMCSAFFLWSEILLTVFHCGEAIFQFSICEKRYKQARQTQGLLLLVFSFWSQPLSADAQLRGSAPVSFHLCSR